jgi:ABC-type molybdate transport system ATPase subunit
MNTLLLNPLRTKFDEALTSFRLDIEAEKVAVIIYADDLNITLTDPTDISLLRNILHTHELATREKINKSKAKALFLGKWNRSIDVMGISYVTETSVLGILSPD